ncbi:MAG: homoserine dehydrogenase [Clostridium sp.]|nr:homoserine dehydrogenase [Prevotella sp.]MCM1429386.1 homoserine dehydrogenase [Clostridium sp.]MCM1475579.1 homoserine dehydrogenase [Muribaculaceae bacterium]
MDKNIKIGLFGFGTVGRGLYDLLNHLPSSGATISKVCVRNINKPRNANVPFTDKADEIFSDPEVNFIVELIDDADASYHIVKRALEMRLPVVTGNKKMLARHLPELIALQKKQNTPLLYDASACGSIPVIRNLEEYYDNDLLISVKGILNGSSNFILSKIFNENMDYATALELAMRDGFLESDPSLDLDGWDSLFKLVIICVHAFGVYVSPDKLFTYGITNMNDDDIKFAREKDRRVKLVAHVEKTKDNRLFMCVIPQLISRNKYIYSVEDEFNGVVIKGLYYDKQFMFGRGAGARPTSSAVLSDIMACRYDYKYEYKKLRHSDSLPVFSNDVTFRIYLRFHDRDDLELLRFEEITESYRSEGYNYVVGKLKLSSLMDVRQQLADRGLFVAAYPYD